jgi:hypothetical protein
MQEQLVEVKAPSPMAVNEASGDTMALIEPY